MKKILIVRFSSIGDIAWTSPVIRCVKTQMPNAELHYCTKERYRKLVEANPYIDKLHYLKEDLNQLISELKKEKFDYVIDLHRNIRTLLIKLRLGTKSSTYDKLRIQRFLYTNFQINLMPNVHVVDRYMEAAKPLGIKNDNKGLDFFIPEIDEVDIDWLPATHRSGFVAYVIGGTGFTKILPFEKMVTLCDKINRPIVLIGAKEDEERGNQLVDFFERTDSSASYEEGLKKLNKRAIIFNGCGKFNLGQSASLVKKADFVFGHDTGLTHIAAAFKKTIYSIWGGTVPNNFYSYGTKFYLLENTRLNCRPCSKSGRKKCPRKHFKCMKENPLDFYLPEDYI